MLWLVQFGAAFQVCGVSFWPQGQNVKMFGRALPQTGLRPNPLSSVRPFDKIMSIAFGGGGGVGVGGAGVPTQLHSISPFGCFPLTQWPGATPLSTGPQAA